MLAADPTLTLTILRQNLHVVRLIHASAVRKRKPGLAASEAARIVWIEQRIAELAAQASQTTDPACAD